MWLTLTQDNTLVNLETCYRIDVTGTTKLQVAFAFHPHDANDHITTIVFNNATARDAGRAAILAGLVVANTPPVTLDARAQAL